MTLRLLLADDHEVIRAGFREMLAGSPVEIVCEASSGREAIDLGIQCDWNVALIDISMPDLNGFAVKEQLRVTNPKLPIVLLAEHDYPRLIARVSASGTIGLVTKYESRESLIEKLQHAATARPGRSRKQMPLVQGPSDAIQIRICLTDREREVLRQLASGPTNKEIAQVLSISYETVKEHVQHILQKVGVADRTQAAVWAVRNGLI